MASGLRRKPAEMIALRHMTEVTHYNVVCVALMCLNVLKVIPGDKK